MILSRWDDWLIVTMCVPRRRGRDDACPPLPPRCGGHAGRGSASSGCTAGHSCTIRDTAQGDFGPIGLYYPRWLWINSDIVGIGPRINWWTVGHYLPHIVIPAKRLRILKLHPVKRAQGQCAFIVWTSTYGVYLSSNLLMDVTFQTVYLTCQSVLWTLQL